MSKFKILLTNLEYGRGMDGSIKDWLTKNYRLAYTPKKVEEKALNQFRKIIQDENPNLICISEIKKNQIHKLINEKYQYHDINIKYSPENRMGKDIFHKNNCNAFISKQKLPFKKHFIKTGTKTLLYEILLPNNITLIFFHFSQLTTIRTKQLKEVYEMFKNVNPKIICGDFNLFWGIQELNQFLNELKLKVIPKNFTFPTSNPNKNYDLFLVSNNLNVKAKILNYKFSDHLPIILEINL